MARRRLAFAALGLVVVPACYGSWTSDAEDAGWEDSTSEAEGRTDTGPDSGAEDAGEAELDVPLEVPDDGGPDNPVYPFCLHDVHCGADEFCDFPAGTCFAPGTCVPRGTGECSDVPAPVCGCDGRTHDSHCLRRLAGVSTLHDGDCSDLPCAEGDPAGVCPDGRFCEGPANPTCSTTGDAGWCEAIPATCPRIDDLVCACNGNTYANDCERKRAGPWRAHFEMAGYCWSP